MSRLKSIYYHICSALPTRLLLNLSSPGTLFPYHHVVSDEWLPHIAHLYSYKNRKQFINDLDTTLKYLRPVSVGELVDSVSHGRNLPKNKFLLTFDDGFKEIHEVVAPILKAKGLPAIFFINPAFVNNVKFFYRCKISLLLHEMEKIRNDAQAMNAFAKKMQWKFRSYPETKEYLKRLEGKDEFVLDQAAGILGFSFEEYFNKTGPFLNSDQISELKRDGFTIGAHSWDHPYFQSLSGQDQLDQVKRSVQYVKGEYQQSPLTFSFPHSDVGLSQNLFNEILKPSYELGLIFGIQNQKSELQNRMVHRFNAERPETPMGLQLNGILTAILMRKMLGRNGVNRQ